jgi:hypothetical protein
MKNLIKILIATAALVFASQLYGQEFKQAKGSTKLLTITQVLGKIVISEHNGSNIIIKAEGYKKKDVPEKAKGLKQISANGVENTGIGLSMIQRGEALEFMSVDIQSNPITYHFQVPKGMAVKIDNSKMFHNVGGYFPALEAKELARDIKFAVKEAHLTAKEAIEAAKSKVYVYGETLVPPKPPKSDKKEKSEKAEYGVEVNSFSGELEIRTMVQGMKLKDVTGPLTINSMSGPINIEFSSVSQSAPITITSYSAEIDVTMPSNTKANLKLSSMNGDIYTDFDINFNKEKKQDGLRFIGGGSNISGTLNGGGVSIMLKALSDNIYLRKK